MPEKFDEYVVEKGDTILDSVGHCHLVLTDQRINKIGLHIILETISDMRIALSPSKRARRLPLIPIEYRLTHPNHPWTNGQVERMNRTLQEATAKKYYCQTYQHLKELLYTFLMAYNFAKRLKTLYKDLLPMNTVVKSGTRTRTVYG